MLSNVLQIRTAHYKYQYSTEKEVVRKSFLLMGTGGLRGCMISHSTDANPTIRHQPLHCHNAPLSCTSTSYLKLNPALDINLCFAVFHILCVEVKTLHSIFCTTIPQLACSQDTSASKSKPLHSRHIRYKEGVPSITKFSPKKSPFFYAFVSSVCFWETKCVCHEVQRCNLPPYIFPQLSII